MSIPGFNVTAWTDGSCLRNPDGPGGWAVVFMDGRQISGHEASTTNNRMELRAIIEAVKLVPHGRRAVIWTDSQLCVKCGSGSWKRRANKDLWREFDLAMRKKNVRIKWLKGHNGDPMNERADELAKLAAHRKTTNGLRRISL